MMTCSIDGLSELNVIGIIRFTHNMALMLHIHMNKWRSFIINNCCHLTKYRLCRCKKLHYVARPTYTGKLLPVTIRMIVNAFTIRLAMLTFVYCEWGERVTFESG